VFPKHNFCILDNIIVLEIYLFLGEVLEYTFNKNKRLEYTPTLLKYKVKENKEKKHYQT